MAKERVIVLRGQPVYNEDGTDSAGGIMPGQLVDGISTLVVSAASTTVQSRAYALERDELGNDIDIAYAAGDVVKVGAFAPGQRVLAWLASGQNVAEDIPLEVVAGNLKIVATGAIVARSVEAVDASAGTLRICVEVL